MEHHEEQQREVDGAATDAGPGDKPAGATPDVEATAGDPLAQATNENPQPREEDEGED